MEPFAHGIGPHAWRARFDQFWIVGALCLLLSPAGCSHSGNGVPEGTPLVRVLLLEDQRQVNVSASASPTVHVGDSSGRQLNFPSGIAVPVSLTAAGWRIGSATLGSGEMLLEPSVDGTVRVAGHAYHGRYRFVPIGADRFEVINELDLENYLRGVLRSELYPTWHEEAYKAQAIVARTYALYESRTDGRNRHFDVYADQRSQVYGGISAESALSRDATAATAGIVVAYGPPGRETIFKSYFSSCCGGISQSANDAFGDSYSEPLSEQNRGACCIESPKFNWGPLIISKEEITKRMRAWGAWKNEPLKEMAPVTKVEISGVNRFGRPVRFTVTDVRGTRYSMRSEDFREAVDTDAAGGVKLPSSFCKPVDEGANVRFADGHGFGHGVGMCQWCAEHQAAEGWNDEAIVLTAFRGAKLVRAY